MMNSREVVSRTLSYDRPERIARSFRGSDLLGVAYTCKTHATEWIEVGGGAWEHLDEWGNTWRRLDPTSKGEVAKGVLDDLDDAERYEFPDFSKAEDYRKAAQIRKENPDKWVMGLMPGFAFNIARKLRRLDNYLADILIDRRRISTLHDRIDSLLADMIRNYAAVGVDSIFFPEDWGTQSQTLVSPRLWMQEFFPRFQKLCRLSHDLGLKVFMHSCGQIEAIMPGLIEAGVDLFQFDQPGLHGIDVLAGHQEHAKVTYWSPVDTQKVLPTGDEQKIRESAREMVAKLWRGRGGLIAGYYGDNESIGLDPAWQEWACDEFIHHSVGLFKG